MKLNNIILIVLSAFVASTATLLIVYFVGGSHSAVPATVSTGPTSSTTTATSSSGVNQALTAPSVAKHNNSADCYLIISGKVYDVTSYLNQHPAGAEIIIPYCGADATSAYQSIRKHDSRAQAILSGFYLGDMSSK